MMMSFFKVFETQELITTNAHKITGLFNYTTIMVVVFFILVCVGLFGFSFKYSEKRNKEAEYTYGNTKKHKLITLIIGLAVFFLIDLSITGQSNEDMINEFWNFPKKGDDIVRIEVLGQQWMWNFRYAGRDEIFNTEDDVLTNHELHLPVGKKVEFRITSKDVIHSLYFPNALLKVDAMPGRISRMWFELTKTGSYDIACAEMCGTHHYKMQGKLHVYTQAEYDEWLNEAQTLAEAGNDTENIDNYWGWKWDNTAPSAQVAKE